ncbi:MAG: cyclic nucleotide-binding domain-containing protein [Chloroflexota bacterium]
MSEIKNFLQRVDLFSGLPEAMLEKVAELCRPQSYRANAIIIERNAPSVSFFLIQAGTVNILTAPDPEDQLTNGAVITLGKGQSFGEMSLIDSGVRSATVKAVTDTQLLAIDCREFTQLCESNTDFGYQIMRNIAADLSFKIRHRNMI